MGVWGVRPSAWAALCLIEREAARAVLEPMED
eukprot:CAMPEP_0181209154 /NCGR_PEP_ID=MMETSP1096-20121128/22510_1 /TAXON_ID=156174 ORGANISM="Chrysochromulina ericina, Strain CCMP281" /NCGR_SAMPLE_ID=MMETSP1096 /ASSEMBLY_ACC=CAM_ASM_000453 /LENGTH=31 /DNA_ID= /DNA_START= /DNA_END= /DNA_ORIENTATION=